MRVAIVHDWLVTWRGGEKVLEAVASLYPDAPIFTLFCEKSILPPSLQGREIIVHPVANKLRFMRKMLLPFLPVWIESFDLSGFDLVLSTSSCVAKGVMVDPSARHLCYIHSPMRYIWDQRDEYLGRVRKLPVLGFFVDALSSWLRMWDMTSSTRVDLFVANSSFVKERVRKFYGRQSVVIPPPVDVARFNPSAASHVKGDYVLVAGALVGYKRFDLAIKACEALGRKLVVAGDGPALAYLKSIAGANTRFVERPDDLTWVKLMREAQALLFPGIEDFGITAIEAMAAGTPVIARRRGGAIDFIVEGKTGIFFEEASVEELSSAIRRHSTLNWNPSILVDFASKFSREVFVKKMQVTIEELNEREYLS